MAKVKVQLTFREEPFEVDEDEVPGLRSQGLVVGEPRPVTEPSPDALAKPTPARLGGPKTEGA